MRPLYFVYGDDPGLLGSIVGELKSRVDGPVGAFNLDTLSAAEVDPDRIAAVARQLPVMAPQRVVIVRQAEALDAKAWKPLLPVLEDPPNTCCLAFFGTKKPNESMKAIRLIKAAGGLVPCEQPRGRQLGEWLQDRCEESGARLGRDAGERLIELVGTELGLLDAALQKLATYVGERGRISSKDVDEVVAETREHNIFDLADAVGRRDLAEAMRLLRGVLDDGRNPIQIVGMLAATFRKLVSARSALDAGDAPAEVADKHVSPRLRYNRRRHLRSFVRKVERFTADELVVTMGRLHALDRTLKSSWVPGDLLLNGFLLDLCERPS